MLKRIEVITLAVFFLAGGMLLSMAKLFAATTSQTAQVIITDVTASITTASPAGGTYTSIQSVILSANETATTYYTTDGSTPTTASTVYSSPIAISANTTLKYFSQDTAGNSEAVKTESYIINIPNNPPVLNPIGNKSVEENQTINWTVTAADADKDLLVITASGLKPWMSFDGTTMTVSPDYTQAGTYNVIFTVSDGKLTASETITLTVNNVNRPPILALIEDIAVKEGEAIILKPVTSDPDSDKVTLTYSGWMSSATYTTNYDDAGEHLVTVTASDGTLTVSQEITITVNNTNRAPVLASIGNKSVEENSILTFALSASDADNDTLTYSAINLPKNANFNNATQTFTWASDYTQAGSYTVTFIVSDGKGSASETITITVKNVNRPPVAQDMSVTTDEDAAKAIILLATDADLDALTYSLIAQPINGTLSGLAPNLTYTPNANYNGTDSFSFKANDGNVDSNTAVISLTVNPVNDAPALNPIGNKSVEENQTINWTVTATDADKDLLVITASGLKPWMSFDGTTMTVSPDYTQAGTYNVIFTVSDGKLTASETILLTVNNVNRPPILALIEDIAVKEGEAIILKPVTSDPDSDKVTLTYSGWMSSATYTTNYDDAGEHKVTVTASDGKSNVSQEVKINVSNVNRLPVLERMSDISVKEGEAIILKPVTSDPDSDKVTLTYSGWMSSATYTTNYDDAGEHLVTVAASDGTLTVSQEITITVNNTNRAPVLASIGNKSVEENSILTFALSASDADNDTLTYSAINLPKNANFNNATQTFTWASDYTQAGSYTVTFIVSDGKDSASETITITVKNVNRPPVLKAVTSSLTVVEGKASIITLSGKDPDAEILKYTVSGVSDNFKITDNIFTWTPNYLQAGDYKLIFTVSDGESSASQEAVISVLDVNIAPVLSFIDSSVIDEGKPLTFSIAAVDSGGDTLTYAAAKLPIGASFDPSAKTFTWTPDYTQAGNYKVLFTVTDGVFSDSQIVEIIVNNIDVQAPSTPANFGAAVISVSQINLSWTASTDDLGVAGYNIYRNDKLVVKLHHSVVNYSDINLTAGTTYAYVISAYDAAGNVSANSEKIYRTTPAEHSVHSAAKPEINYDSVSEPVQAQGVIFNVSGPAKVAVKESLPAEKIPVKRASLLEVSEEPEIEVEKSANLKIPREEVKNEEMPVSSSRISDVNFVSTPSADGNLKEISILNAEAKLIHRYAVKQKGSVISLSRDDKSMAYFYVNKNAIRRLKLKPGKGAVLKELKEEVEQVAAFMGMVL